MQRSTKRRLLIALAIFVGWPVFAFIAVMFTGFIVASVVTPEQYLEFVDNAELGLGIFILLPYFILFSVPGLLAASVFAAWKLLRKPATTGTKSPYEIAPDPQDYASEKEYQHDLQAWISAECRDDPDYQRNLDLHLHGKPTIMRRTQ
jgi:hypothetical protein